MYICIVKVPIKIGILCSPVRSICLLFYSSGKSNFAIYIGQSMCVRPSSTKGKYIFFSWQQKWPCTYCSTSLSRYIYGNGAHCHASVCSMTEILYSDCSLSWNLFLFNSSVLVPIITYRCEQHALRR